MWRLLESSPKQSTTITAPTKPSQKKKSISLMPRCLQKRTLVSLTATLTWNNLLQHHGSISLHAWDAEERRNSNNETILTKRRHPFKLRPAVIVKEKKKAHSIMHWFHGSGHHGLLLLRYHVNVVVDVVFLSNPPLRPPHSSPTTIIIILSLRSRRDGKDGEECGGVDLEGNNCV